MDTLLHKVERERYVRKREEKERSMCIVVKIASDENAIAAVRDNSVCVLCAQILVDVYVSASE